MNKIIIYGGSLCDSELVCICTTSFFSYSNWVNHYYRCHNRGWRMLCKSEGAQASGMRTIGLLGGSGGMLPQENLEFVPESASEAI